MTQEEAFVIIGRIEEVVNALDGNPDKGFTPTFNQYTNDLFCRCGDYAEQLMSYVRVTNDKRVIEECIKISGYNRLYPFVGSLYFAEMSINLELKNSLLKAWYILEKIEYINNSYPIEPKLTQTLIQLIDVNERFGNLSKANDKENTDTTPDTDLPRELDTDTGEPAPPQKPILPLGLDNPEGYRIFERAVNEGWLDEDFRPTKKMKKGVISIFANEIGERFRIPNFNALIESFWGVNHLAQAYQKVSYQKNFDTLERDIKQLFN